MQLAETLLQELDVDALLQRGATKVEGTGLQLRDVEDYLLGWAPAGTA